MEAEAEAARAAAQRSLEQRMEQWAGPPPRPTEPDRDADGKVIKPLPLKVIEWEVRWWWVCGGGVGWGVCASVVWLCVVWCMLTGVTTIREG